MSSLSLIVQRWEEKVFAPGRKQLLTERQRHEQYDIETRRIVHEWKYDRGNQLSSNDRADMVYVLHQHLTRYKTYRVMPIDELLEQSWDDRDDRPSEYIQTFLSKLVKRYSDELCKVPGGRTVWDSRTFRQNLTLTNMLHQPQYLEKCGTPHTGGVNNPYSILDQLLTMPVSKNAAAADPDPSPNFKLRVRAFDLIDWAKSEDTRWLTESPGLVQQQLALTLKHLNETVDVDYTQKYKIESDRRGKSTLVALEALIETMTQEKPIYVGDV